MECFFLLIFDNRSTDFNVKPSVVISSGLAVAYIYIFFFLLLFLKSFLLYKVFLSNTNNLQSSVRFQVFLSNTNNSTQSFSFKYLFLFNNDYLLVLYFDLRPGPKCHSRWCTGRKWHIPMAVRRGNRVDGNWLTKWDKLKNPMILS